MIILQLYVLNIMNLGYIYCFSNTSTPEIFIIGSTLEDVETRLCHVNTSCNSRLSTPYVIYLAKKVSNAIIKGKTLSALLQRFTNRSDLDGEFYRISREEIHSFFDLMDGEIWTKPKLLDTISYRSKKASISDLIDFTTIEKGSIVRIEGLLVNNDLNGCIGIVDRKVSNNIGIYRIKFNDYDGGCKYNLIRSENLTLVL
jgi:hypothetical protein